MSRSLSSLEKVFLLHPSLRCPGLDPPRADARARARVKDASAPKK